MAKTIKFNLICDGYPARTLEDLQEHFSVEDILNYYHNGLLSRWLEVRGYRKEKELVDEICSKNSELSIIQELVRIFDIESDKSVIERDTYIFSYREQLLEKMKGLDYAKKKRESFISDYYSEYEGIIAHILQNKENMSSIKADLQEISENYRVLFDLDYRLIFKIFAYHAPKAIFAMLMNEYMRTKFAVINASVVSGNDSTEKRDIPKRADWLANVLKTVYEDPEESASDMAHEIGLDGSVINDIETDANGMYNLVSKLNNPKTLEKILGDDLRVYTGNTEGYAQKVEISGRYLILWISQDVRVNSVNATSTNLGPGFIVNRFRILDGLEFISQKDTAEVYYLKV